MKLTPELAQKMASKMNLKEWVMLQELDHCFICKKFKEPLYIKDSQTDGGKILNGKYLFHLFSTHSLPPAAVVDMIAEKIYKNEDEREKMRHAYRKYENV